MDLKNRLVRDFELEIMGMELENGDELIDKLVKVLENYSVDEMETGLVIYDYNNESLLNRFIATKRIEGKSEGTLTRYYNELIQLVRMLNIPLNEVDTYTLRFYLGKRKETVSSRTLDGIRKILSSFFGFLCNEDLIEKNPARALAPIKYVKKKENPYNSVELAKVKDACTNSRDLALVEFLYSTGCRVSEVVKLNISDMDFENKKCIVMGKGNKQRTVYFDDVTCMRLRTYLANRKDNNEALFVGKGGKRFEDNGIRVMLKRLGRKSGVTNVHPHRYRHTLATNLASVLSLQEVATILGHEDVSTTQIYCTVDKRKVEADYRAFCA